MEGQSGEREMPTVLNSLALAYTFGPVKSTPDGYEAMVPAKSCDINTGRNQAMSAPTTVDACPLEEHGVPSPARSRPPHSFLRKRFPERRAYNIISGGSTNPSFGDKKGGFSNKKYSKLAQSGATPCNLFWKVLDGSLDRKS